MAQPARMVWILGWVLFVGGAVALVVYGVTLAGYWWGEPTIMLHPHAGTAYTRSLYGAVRASLTLLAGGGLLSRRAWGWNLSLGAVLVEAGRHLLEVGIGVHEGFDFIHLVALAAFCLWLTRSHVKREFHERS